MPAERLQSVAGACLASELPMQSVPANSIVSFSADLDRLFGFGFPLGQVTELCALRTSLLLLHMPLWRNPCWFASLLTPGMRPACRRASRYW